MLDHRLDKLCVRRFFGQAELFEFCFFFSHHVYRPQTGLFDQRCQLLLSKRFDVVIHLFEINAVFTKQRRKVAARRSGGFFVDGDIVHSYASAICGVSTIT